MLTEKQMKIKLSEIVQEKLNEGLYLSFSNLLSSDYKTLIILEDKDGNKYGLGLKVIYSKNYPEPDRAIIQYGKLDKNRMFTFEDEKNAAIEKFYLYNKRYFEENEMETLRETLEYRRKFAPCFGNWYRFSVKSLNIKGLKQTKAKIEIIRNASGYIILKDNTEFKRVNFSKKLK